MEDQFVAYVGSSATSVLWHTDLGVPLNAMHGVTPDGALLLCTVLESGSRCSSWLTTTADVPYPLAFPANCLFPRFDSDGSAYCIRNGELLQYDDSLNARFQAVDSGVELRGVRDFQLVQDSKVFLVEDMLTWVTPRNDRVVEEGVFRFWPIHGGLLLERQDVEISPDANTATVKSSLTHIRSPKSEAEQIWAGTSLVVRQVIELADGGFVVDVGNNDERRLLLFPGSGAPQAQTLWSGSR